MKIPRSKNTHLLIAIVSHVSFLAYSLFLGVNYLVSSLILGLLIYNLTAQLFMHRSVTHGQFSFSSPIVRTFCILFSMCNFGSLAVNCAIHIDHHKFSDTERDPHNFREIGLFRTLVKDWGKELLPSPKTFAKFLKNQEIKKQHFNNVKYAIFASVFVPFLPVVSFWLINLLFIVVHLGVEDQRFVNAPWLFPLMWGEEMHMDHHINPGKKKMHPFDLMYFSGKVLERFG